MHGPAPGSSWARAAPGNPHGAYTRLGRGKSSPTAPASPASAFTARRPAGLGSPQCHACCRGTLQCHARRGACKVTRALGIRAVPVSRADRCNSGARQAACSHSHNKPRTSPGGREQSPSWAALPRGVGGAGGGSLAAGTGGRCLQEAAEPRASWPPSAHPRGWRDREPPDWGQQRRSGKTLLRSFPVGRGQRDVSLPSLLLPRAPLPRHIPARRLPGTRVLRWGWPGPDTWRPTHDHGLGHGERHMSRGLAHGAMGPQRRGRAVSHSPGLAKALHSAGNRIGLDCGAAGHGVSQRSWACREAPPGPAGAGGYFLFTPCSAGD